MEAVANTAGSAAKAATRVLFVAPPAVGGLAGHVIALLSGLHRDGYALRVVCETEGRIATVAADLGIPVDGMRCTAEGGPSRVAIRAVRLARIIRGFRPHVVHTHSFGASMTGAAACAIARSGELVITIHNYPPGTGAMAPARQGQRWAFDKALQRASRVITVSEALRRDLLVAYPEVMARSTTIYNGVETHIAVSRRRSEIRAEHALPTDGPLVGMVARLAPQKGILEFIRAARLVADSHPSVAFALAGDGPLKDDATKLSGELRLSERMRFLGHIDWVRELISAMDVLVISSLSEGSSVVAMEAMALQRPVVATSVGGVPEVVIEGDTGMLVSPGDAEALAGAVIEMLRDPERARQMGERGRQRAVREFDISDMIERTKAVYADVIRETLADRGARA